VTAVIEHARELVMEFGWNSTSYQILNPGIDLWFAAPANAVIGYTRRHGVLLVAGAPICPLAKLEQVCHEFELFAQARRCSVCYVCAEERLRSFFAPRSDHSTVALGAQPAWNPQDWPNLVAGHSSLRAQLRRSLNKSVRVEEMPTAEGRANAEIRDILHDWLSSRGLPPLHFLTEPHLLAGVVQDRVLLVARRDARIVAFLVTSPIPAKQGFMVELLARSREAPNGVSELLIDAAMRRFAAKHFQYGTLGLVALAHASDREIQRNPIWLQWMMRFARAHANRFYNFRGLEQFRVKMRPERWETLYAISNERRFSIRTLYAVGAAFSGIPPWMAIGVGAVKAIGEEFRRLLPT